METGAPSQLAHLHARILSRLICMHACSAGSSACTSHPLCMQRPRQWQSMRLHCPLARLPSAPRSDCDRSTLSLSLSRTQSQSVNMYPDYDDETNFVTTVARRKFAFARQVAGYSDVVENEGQEPVRMLY